MKKKDFDLRTLDQVSKEELRDASVEFCRRLNIYATLSYYNVHEALENERIKAVELSASAQVLRKITTG